MTSEIMNKFIKSFLYMHCKNTIYTKKFYESVAFVNSKFIKKSQNFPDDFFLNLLRVFYFNILYSFIILKLCRQVKSI